jgi:hypothetical protein
VDREVGTFVGEAGDLDCEAGGEGRQQELHRGGL